MRVCGALREPGSSGVLTLCAMCSALCSMQGNFSRVSIVMGWEATKRAFCEAVLCVGYQYIKPGAAPLRGRILVCLLCVFAVCVCCVCLLCVAQASVLSQQGVCATACVLGVCGSGVCVEPARM